MDDYVTSRENPHVNDAYVGSDLNRDRSDRPIPPPTGVSVTIRRIRIKKVCDRKRIAYRKDW